MGKINKSLLKENQVDDNFKLEGEGQGMMDSCQTLLTERPSTYQSLSQDEGSANSAQRQAAAAAFARLEKKKNSSTSRRRSAALIRAIALKELEVEKQATVQQKAANLDNDAKSEPKYVIDGVFYKCPLIGAEVLPKNEIEERIKNFLYQQLDGEEAGLAALNKPKEKVQQCVEMLSRYLDNIVESPEEEIYRKIRIANKVYREKVAPVERSQQFLQAAGFQVKSLPNAISNEIEDFWVYSSARKDHVDYLASLRDGLLSGEPIRPELDRGRRVLMPSQAITEQRIALPPDFFCLTLDEIKREQQLRTERVERNLMLRTKAMRERDEHQVRQQRKYRFTLIRIRLPDGSALQGTFKVTETMQDVRHFVADALPDPTVDFSLTSTVLLADQSEQNDTLLQLKLCPSAILHFQHRMDR